MPTRFPKLHLHLELDGSLGGPLAMVGEVDDLHLVLAERCLGRKGRKGRETVGETRPLPRDEGRKAMLWERLFLYLDALVCVACVHVLDGLLRLRVGCVHVDVELGGAAPVNVKEGGVMGAV